MSFINYKKHQIKTPGNVFPQESLCQGKYKFNCKFVKYKPQLSLNYQPVAGIPLKNKYIQEMGSSLSKKIQMANLINNASAHRKNTVKFITRSSHCGQYINCEAPPKCSLSTGNRNPNYNPL